MSSVERAKARSETLAVFQQREAALRELIRQDPQAAVALALSPEALAQVAEEFPALASNLESHGIWEGVVQQWVMDDPPTKSHRTITRLVNGPESFEVYFTGPVSANLACGSVVQARGIRVGDVAAIVSAHVTGTTDQNCSTTGVQNTVVLLATFPGVTPPTGITPSSVRQTFFGTTGRSLDGFLREASYGRASATGDVFGWYTLSSAYDCNSLGQARDEAMAMATAAGVDFLKYKRIFLIYPNTIGCVAGFAQVGCSLFTTPSGSFQASIAYIGADYMAGDQGVHLTSHEMGHNLGLQHSGTLDFGTETLGPIGATGTVNDFGDYWSTMGSEGVGIFAAPHKAEVLGWLDAGANYQTVQSSGTWTIQPMETSPAGLQALKIQRGTGNPAWLWVEYRQPVGNYDSTLMTQPFGGALIHYEDPNTGAFTRLLNFVPTGSWDTWWYPALLAGKTWTDPYSNLTLTVQSATPTGLTLTATYGSTPCTHAAPGISISPTNPSTQAGGSTAFSIALTNRDSAGCPAGVFTLSSSQPSNWSSTFSTASLTINPGQSAAATMTKVAPSNAAAATYSVDATAATSATTGTTQAYVTVTAPAMTVTVSIPNATYSVRDSVALGAVVSNGSSRVSGASVKFTLTDPTGIKTTKTATTDSTGTAAWTYRIGSKGPLGIYSVVVSASAGSQTATSSAATFAVK